MSTPPVNYAMPPPGINVPPPRNAPPPIHQVHRPAYRPPTVYSHNSYHEPRYPSPFPYYPPYQPINVPPPSYSAYPPPSATTYFPPKPVTAPPASVAYRSQYYSPINEVAVKCHVQNWHAERPPMTPSHITIVKKETLSTPPLSECGSEKGSNDDKNHQIRDSTPSSSNKKLSPKRETESVEKGAGRESLREQDRMIDHSRDNKQERERQYLEREQDREKEYLRNRENNRKRERSRDKEWSRDREHSLDSEWLKDRARSRDREQRAREQSYARERECQRERRYREHRSRSPSYSSHRFRSPSRYSERDRKYHDRRYDRDRERERYLDEKRDYERKRYEYERYRSPPRYRDHRSESRSSDPHRLRSPSRTSRGHYSQSRDLERRSHTRESSHISRDGPALSKKPLTDREKILEEFNKNYCRTSQDFLEKMEQWSKEHHSEEEEQSAKLWYRCSPAELYYKKLDGQSGVQQTKKLEKVVDAFFTTLIERGRNARPAVDELPPLRAKARMCSKHNNDKSSSSSSSEEDDIDDEGLEGYTDRIMLELQRKQSHPRRLHSEMWFNNPGEMNGGPLCRCSARARRFGMRHGVYAGEQTFPKCVPHQSNIDKLYHYRITVSPPTNFLIKNPTIIGHDEHEFLFSGFSMFSHYKLAKLPTCKVIRFNIEYTILYVEEPPPENFTVQELEYFEEFLFIELLELVDLDLGRPTDSHCSQFHFMPRFVRLLAEGGCEVLSMCEVMKYIIQESGLLIPPDNLTNVHEMDPYTWQKFVDKIKGMIVTYPGKKPCSVRVDQLDRSPPLTNDKSKETDLNKFFPEIVHFGIRPPQLSYAGNPEYQKAWRYYVKYRHLIANMAKPTYKERTKLATKEAKLQEMRTQSKMKRDVTVAMSSEGFHTTGLMCDVVQHAMLIPVLVRHLRFHKSLEALEKKIGYVFKQRLLLQTALTHPSYRENFGTNPDHARNSLTNCGIRQPEYGDRRIHYTRKKGIVTLINIMSRFGKRSETESEIKHNERLEFLGDAVVEFISSIHLFRMFPGLAEGGLATYRASIVQNQHLAQLAKNIDLEQFMLYAHGSDLCREVVMKHAMANCFEALMGALFLDAGLQVADRVFALALWHEHSELNDVWLKERLHPLQEQEPLGDRQYIKDFEFLQKLTEFEESIGVEFKHIRLLARAFTDRSVGFTHLTLGSNQRLEFLGDTVLQLVVSARLYRHFPDHHEGHLSLLRSSLVNNRTQSMVCDDLNMSAYAIYNNPKAKPTTKKHKADLLEAFLGALYIDKSLEYCIAFCNACLFPRLQEFIMNQDWNDPKSKLQQCCLTLRSMEGGEPDIPLYKVIECMGPTNTRVYSVGVYFRGMRLASSRGHSIQDAEMNAAEAALSKAHELFPQLDHQKRVIAKSMRKKKKVKAKTNSPRKNAPRQDENVPKAYRLDQKDSDDSSNNPSEDEATNFNNHAPSEDESTNLKKEDDSGLDSDLESLALDKHGSVQPSTLVSDMEKVRAEMIRKNEYDKLKERCRRSESDED